MPNTLVHSKWDSGELVFHDADDWGVSAEIFRISPSTIYIGTATNDVTMTMYGDVTLYGDMDLIDEDISVAMGGKILLDGPTGTEYLMSDTQHYLEINAGTGITLTISDTDEVAIDATAVTLATNNLILSAGNITVAAQAYIYLDGGTNDYIRTSSDNNVIVNGNSTSVLGVAGTSVITAAGSAVTIAQETTISDATASSGTGTGCLILGGGLGVAEDIYIGGDFYLPTGKKIDFNAGDITLTHTSGILTMLGGDFTIGAAGETVNDVTFYGESNMKFFWNSSTPALVLTDAPVASTITGDAIGFTATINATTAYTGWALGYFGTTTLSNTDGTVGNAAGGCFEVNFTDAMTGGVAGMVVGCYIGAYSSSTKAGSVPTAGLWVETIAINSDMSATPVISIVTSGSGGTESEIAFALGNAQAVKTVSTGATGMYYNETIHIVANGAERYIPLSTIAGTYTTAYPIATTSTIISTCTSAGISCTASTLHASDGRIGVFVGSVVNPDQGDGYGIFEMQANFSGTVPSGSIVNAASFWINLAEGTTSAGTMLCVQNNGIWAPSGLTLSTTNLIIGMRMHCEIAGGTQPERISCFSINVPANHLTSLWQTNVIEDLNDIAKKTGDAVAIPWLVTTGNGTVYYVNAYTT